MRALIAFVIGIVIGKVGLLVFLGYLKKLIEIAETVL